jgi:hypothetical protein
MKKKKSSYEKPELHKVRLDVKTSVLSVCRTSIVVDPADTCQLEPGGCWYPT